MLNISPGAAGIFACLLFLAFCIAQCPTDVLKVLKYCKLPNTTPELSPINCYTEGIGCRSRNWQFKSDRDPNRDRQPHTYSQFKCQCKVTRHQFKFYISNS